MGKFTRRCTVQFHDRTFCDLESHQGMPFPICAKHALKLYKRLGEFTETEFAGLSVDLSKAPTGRIERARRNEALAAVIADRPTIYAVRCDDGVIKLGYSRNLTNRLGSFGASSELLGFQFGTFEDEQALHESLPDEHRVRGREWYRPTPEVLAVVNAMRADFGLKPIAA